MAFGSSPLARGTQQRQVSGRRFRRLIPARAGNTFLMSSESMVQTAHPRSRGEHVVSGATSPAVPGSSPLARGTREVVPAGAGAGRLIPARAGNTSS